ncbi:hypothetical protein LXL04_016729 [Taraxacum kok-saghyz]
MEVVEVISEVINGKGEDPPRGGREQEEENKLQELLAQITLSDKHNEWYIPNAHNDEYTTRWLKYKILEKGQK